MKTNAFASLHPLTGFVYFTAVIGFGMFIMHPIFLAIGLFCAFFYSLMLNGARALKFNLFLIPMFFAFALFNPLFNHEGVTILFYFLDNPITYESIIYGIMAAAMLVLAILWFSCFNAVVTSDEIMYLFGRTAPKMSLIFSMVLRLVPKYKNQLKTISAAQAGMYRAQGLKQKIARGVKILSALITWALEDGIDTARSMRARGYGLPNRTSYFTYKMDGRNKIYLIFLAFLIIVVIAGVVLGAARAMYFPFIKFPPVTDFSIIVYLAYFLLCAIPIICTLREELIWKRLKSRL